MRLSDIDSNSWAVYSSAFTFKKNVIFDALISKVNEIFESIKGLFRTTPSELINVTGNFLGGIFGVTAFYTMLKGFERVFSKPKLTGQIEGALTVIESMGKVAKSTVSVGEGLEKAAIITKNSLGWVSAISFFGAFLSAASIINSAKKCFEGYTFSQNLKDLKKSDNTYRLAIDSFKSLEGIKKNTQLEKRDLFSRIDHLLTQVETDEQEELSQKIYETLRTRVQSKIRSHALFVLAGVVSLVGSAILFASPAAPIGLTFIAVATAISIAQYIYNWQKNKEFESMLKPLPVP